MLITTITPTIPTAFFKIATQPITVSTASPKIFPTTGIKFDTAAFVVLAVIPSTVLLRLPSTEANPTNIVSTIPNIHTIDELKNLDNLSSCILSDTFETIAKAVEINTNGIIIILIKFPINVIKKSNIGSNKLADVKLPVVSINVISIGIRLFINQTNLSIEFLKFC